MPADLGDNLERFVVGVYQELGGDEVATEAFDGSDNAAGSSPGFFVVEGSVVDEDDGENRAAGLFLLEGCAEAVEDCVTV